MYAVITRKKQDDKQTLGILELFDETGKILFTCKTLELPWKNNKNRVSCIDARNGMPYKVVPRYTAKRKAHFHVLDVKGRTWILIHSGNYYSDILGCILVGSEYIDINNDGYKDVVNSRPTLRKLAKLAPKGFELFIIYEGEKLDWKK